ncbi:hypothetical protein N7468_001544 [Penicillium chermesinum]|uniref:Uncharacterized protein n=1 Tax=Penicillium chermesinum TaxID=63820 RepID=A0A9W9TWN2_9EURO|nr:uncharacterized protein N7468_001544 [Penicillium chermesinum]KAJ5246561.1 hypothetical protein N7468_001544 [Penicillium chermesinum]
MESTAPSSQSDLGTGMFYRSIEADLDHLKPAPLFPTTHPRLKISCHSRSGELACQLHAPPRPTALFLA